MKALHEEDTYDIPMTSLIDCVFLLLIFFLVATTFHRIEMDHMVTLPESEAGAKSESAQARLVINIREDGTLIVNGRVVNENDLRLAAMAFVNAGPTRPAVIRADARVPYRAVMKVFGICRASGVKHIDLPIMEPSLK